jgi:hypothetical protein
LRQALEASIFDTEIDCDDNRFRRSSLITKTIFMNIQLPNLQSKKRFLPFILIAAGLLVSFRHSLTNLVTSADLDLQIEHAPALMPAVYKVYGNENALNGKYSLFKMLVTNKSKVAARNVEVSYQVTNYVDWTTITKIPVILPGQSVVVNCYPSLPDKIVEKTTSSKEKVNIRVKGGNVSEEEEQFDIDVKGRNEFLYTCIPREELRTNADIEDNNDLIACFVTPEDPVIKYYTQKIQEKILKGEVTIENKDEEGIRFLKGIYQSTYISHMVYSGTSGVPAKLDDVESLVQSLRLPREVVTGKTGLCIELSIMYASIMAAAGMQPVIYLIPNHAYPGFVMNNHYYAIEATAIGGEGIGGRQDADQAFQAGMKELDEFIKAVQSGDDRYTVLDIRDAINRGAVAMELKDDSYLRQKIDDITQGWEAMAPGADIQQYVNNNGNDNNAGNNDNGDNNQDNNQTDDNNTNQGNTPNGYNSFDGVVHFSYPGSWKIAPKNPQALPQTKYLITNNDNTAYVEVYKFDGYSSIDQAMSTLKQWLGQYGANVSYKAAGRTNAGYTILNGQTSYNGGAINWMAAFKSSANGIVGIASGANDATGTKYQSTVATIINSLR